MIVVRTDDGVSHGIEEGQGRAYYLKTVCGLSFASWMYKGMRQGRKNRRRPTTMIPEVATGTVDCMTCLVRAAQP